MMPKPLENRVPASELRWQIAPGAPSAGNLQNRFQEKPSISPSTARITRLTETMRFDLCPLGFGQA